MTESSAATVTVLSIELVVVSVVVALLLPQANKKILQVIVIKPTLFLIVLFMIKDLYKVMTSLK
jgi:hypothetical protein